MKKLFSFMLIAAALLISGQMKAFNCPIVEGKLDVAKAAYSSARKLSVTNGHETKEDGDVAKIGSLYFSTLTDAFNAIEAGETATIQLINDATFTSIELKGGKNITLDLNGYNIGFTSYFDLYDVYFKITGHGTIRKTAGSNASAAFYIQGSNVRDAVDWDVLVIDSEVTLEAPGYVLAVYTYLKDPITNKYCAYGVRVDIYGTLISSLGTPISILGSINSVDGNSPIIHVHDGALVSGEGGNGIYAAGFGTYIIEGEVSGAVAGIYAKAGNIEIKGNAIIRSTSEEYDGPQQYGNGTKGGSGCALILDTNLENGYAGQMTVSVTGNPTFTTESGYALLELATDGGSSSVVSITIDGGNFKGGTEGCILTSEEVRQEIVNNATLTGGIFNEDIINYVNTANKVITYVDTDEGEQKWTIGNIPSGQTWKDNFETPNSYVQLNSANPTVTEVTGIKNIEYLAVIGQDKVIVKSGARLNVGEVVLNEDAVLVIEPKAMVVVTSKQGIISTSNENIIIEADATDYGQLLINPEVTFNTTPRATVELTTRSFAKSDSYLYERVAIPFGFVVDDLSCEGDVETYFEKYNYATKNWDALGFLNAKGTHAALDFNDLNDPFVNYQFLTNSATPGVKYTFKGKLVGNTSKTMTLRANFWNGFGNSYVAEMDVKTLLDAIEEQFSGSSDNLAVYYYKCVNESKQIYEWKPVSELNLNTKLKLRPMEVFLIENDGAAMELPIDYKTMIWDTKAE